MDKTKGEGGSREGGGFGWGGVEGWEENADNLFKCSNVVQM